MKERLTTLLAQMKARKEQAHFAARLAKQEKRYADYIGHDAVSEALWPYINELQSIIHQL